MTAANCRQCRRHLVLRHTAPFGCWVTADGRVSSPVFRHRLYHYLRMSKRSRREKAEKTGTGQARGRRRVGRGNPEKVHLGDPRGYITREVANTVCSLEGGVIVEPGPPERIFGGPTEQATWRFLQRIMDAGRL